LELKPGPYEPLTDKDFAPWAPEEECATCPAFEQWFREGALRSRFDGVTAPKSVDSEIRERLGEHQSLHPT